MTCLSNDYQQEQREYFCQTAAWTDVHPSQLLGPPAVIASFHLKTVTLQELKAPLKAS
jgi:type I protein arginine methyltransferase